MSSDMGTSRRGLDSARFVLDDVEYHYLVVPRLAPQGLDGLTNAELDVAVRAAAGESNRAIAAARGSTESTVGNQIASVFAKLGISSRAELIGVVIGGGSTR